MIVTYDGKRQRLSAVLSAIADGHEATATATTIRHARLGVLLEVRQVELVRDFTDRSAEPVDKVIPPLPCTIIALRVRNVTSDELRAQ